MHQDNEDTYSAVAERNKEKYGHEEYFEDIADALINLECNGKLPGPFQAYEVLDRLDGYNMRNLAWYLTDPERYLRLRVKDA